MYHTHARASARLHLFVHSVFIGVVSWFLLALILPVLAQESVEELRNSYNFVQAGLNTLAAGASVALCLARGRLDSEMILADFLAVSRFHVQNKYGSKVSSPTGENGTIIGVSLGDGSWNRNAVMWISHNTWAQGSTAALVKLCVGLPAAYYNGAAPSSPAMAASSAPAPLISNSTTSSPTVPTSATISTLSVPPDQPPSSLQALKRTASASSSCTCWHIPSISANSACIGGAASLDDLVPTMNPRDPQCYRVPSYQCHMHGQGSMPTIHDQVQRDLARGRPLYMSLQGPSRLVQYMLDDEKEGVPIVYFFGMDNLGARTLKRMVSESMATQDASQKGRTPDLVEWSLGRLELSEKVAVMWKGHASTVVFVSLLELILMFVLCGVFGLDPFVSCLGARRGIRSLRLGPGGVTVFADLWLLEVRGYTIEGWERTPVLRVKPRKSMGLWYCDTAIKVAGLGMVFGFWIAFVFGFVHPLGLKRTEAWANHESWSIYVGMLGTAIGFFTSAPLTGVIERFVPTMKRGKGFHMLRVCWGECLVELTVGVLRILEQKRRLSWGVLPWWYVTMEVGIWLQWLTAKRVQATGPHSQSRRRLWAFTFIQAGAFARATVLAAVSGSWRSS